MRAKPSSSWSMSRGSRSVRSSLRTASPRRASSATGRQIADALAHAHERGIVHRDLKSQNVVITPEGRAKVLDFGLAARMPSADAEAVTKTQEAIPHAGMLVGTLAYMAPEVLRGDAATARSDIWALGVLLYEMASGRLPFEGETALDVTSAIAKESPRALPSRVSAGFRSVVQRCLQKEPGSRYSAVVAVQSALETIQSDTGTQQASIAPVGATRTWRAAAAVIGLVLVAGVIGYWLRPGPETSAFGVLGSPTRSRSRAPSARRSIPPGRRMVRCWLTSRTRLATGTSGRPAGEFTARQSHRGPRGS